MPKDASVQWAASVFKDYDPGSAPAPHRLPGAGSDRSLFRLFLPAGTVILVENPLPPSEGPNENDSFVYLAAHLRARGLPVPEVHAYDRDLGIYLLEDLDDDDLFGKVRVGLAEEELRGLYREGVALLARLQVEALEGLDTGRLHTPPRYDGELMLQWESGYFQRELLDHLLGMGGPPPPLVAEFEKLAGRASQAGTDFFLHRDFQSRNIKLYAGDLWVIDFQGARLGPPQYDLAAFLFDPYVELPSALRGELLSNYLARFLPATGFDRARFLDGFPFVAAHRLMQTLGAYAFLGAGRGKEEFLEFISPALRLLRELLDSLPAGEFPELDRAAGEARERWEERRPVA